MRLHLRRTNAPAAPSGPSAPTAPLPDDFAQWLGPQGTAWAMYPRDATAALQMYLAATGTPDPIAAAAPLPDPLPDDAGPVELAEYQAAAIRQLATALTTAP